MEDILLSADPLSIDACYAAVQDPSCGGICLFVGTIRNQNKGAVVTHLEFSSYDAMALREMRRIAEAAREMHGLHAVSVHHRTGALAIGDVAVIIAVSSVHRAAAFAGCAWVIDELKKSVPIWKKEFLEDGSYWVGARP
ncbi:molybdenum cofactor biosynthesis protein MoaE [Neolewinella lacunae]|uniref:Molybdopterin synthase catalytic subunit n=1 Tax=Neolewinella lacunae TaxID=1517758 RepID=A0A923T5Z4_9BACT|nr:molybdenum cofactor biosynthesis protein MoaE [Neolewinella lacunae]MBC6992860.1 molybdenum cofactor biosynthesis protein MoaE [Neolewinella lacunae]MDN3633776.1 molybdenum cofactor biosynthesis protein MoaE [Neolewinella lacunae]